jgi:CheY-like chemotaxis protein
MQPDPALPELTVVLVVEDEALLRSLACDFLQDAGCTVLEAGDASQALETLEAQADSVHVLFTDVHMPGDLDGVHLAHRARASWPWIHLIVASGQLMPRADELPEGCRFLPKPYELNHVMKHIRSAMLA